MDNTHLAALSDEVRKEFPSFNLVKKSDSKLMAAISAFLKAITFGQMKAFMEDFVTTVGTTVYVPSRWEF